MLKSSHAVRGAFYVLLLAIHSLRSIYIIWLGLDTICPAGAQVIAMTSAQTVYMCTCKRLKCLAQVGIHPQSTMNLHDMLTSLPASLNLPSNTGDIIYTQPSSAGSNPASPTTSVSSSTYSVTPISEYTVIYLVNIVIITDHMYIQWQFRTVVSP